MKTHKVALLFALLIGFIYVGPNVYFMFSDSYKGLPIIATDAENLYLTIINGATKGCTLNCNPYIKEYGYKFPYYNVSISGAVLAIPSIVLGISIPVLKVVYEFLLPMILFLLAYSLVYRLTKNISVSLLSGLTILLGSNLVNAKDLTSVYDLMRLTYLKTELSQFFIFSRPVYPQLSTPFFFIYLHILLSTMRHKSKKWFGLLGLAYGVSFYVYFFIYSFITVVHGVLIGVSIIKKEWSAVKGYLGASLLGLVLAIPVFISIKNLFAHPYFFTIPTQYLVKTHIPHITVVGLLLLMLAIVCAYFYARKHPTLSPEAYYIGILIASCFITRNEHVVSGMIMQYDHYELYIFTPILVMTIAFCLHTWCEKYTKLIAWITGVILVLNGVVIATASYKHWFDYTVQQQRFVPVLEWVKVNIEKKSVISAPEELASIIPFYTSHYVTKTTLTNQWIHIPNHTIKPEYTIVQTIPKMERGWIYQDDLFTVYRAK